MLLESEAAAGGESGRLLLGFWQKLAKDMERMRPRPASYFDAWHRNLSHGSRPQQKETAKAETGDASGVSARLSPSVGGPEMKAEKYQGLLHCEAQMKNMDGKNGTSIDVRSARWLFATRLMAAFGLVGCVHWASR